MLNLLKLLEFRHDVRNGQIPHLISSDRSQSKHGLVWKIVCKITFGLCIWGAYETESVVPVSLGPNLQHNSLWICKYSELQKIWNLHNFWSQASQQRGTRHVCASFWNACSYEFVFVLISPCAIMLLRAGVVCCFFGNIWEKTPTFCVTVRSGPLGQVGAWSLLPTDSVTVILPSPCDAQNGNASCRLRMKLSFPRC